MMVTMWVYLETWMVGDGALPELARGSNLRDVGLRAECGSIGSAQSAVNGIAELAGPGGEQGPGKYRYELTGVAGPAEDVWTERGHAGSEFVITAGDEAFVACTAGPASEVAAGSRVTAQCTLSVVADYEWDAFGLPDLRTDWYVPRLAIEHRPIDELPAVREGLLSATRARCFAHLRSNVSADGTMTGTPRSWPGTCSI
jgi:hypothetical protein